MLSSRLIKFDIHTHHERCGHADGKIELYIQAAIDNKLTAIGISDHTPYFGHDDDQPFPHIAMAKSDFANYVNEVLELKEKYKDQIDVLLGIESDFFPKYAEIYKAQLLKHPFDYIIGSVHHVDELSIFNKNRWKRLDKKGLITTKETYYNLIAESAKSGLFQILGHIDAMKAYYPEFSTIPANHAVDAALQTIAEHQVAIEVNTSGKTKQVGGWYPSAEILERAYHFGVNISFGSDAHNPLRVSEDFEDVAKLLKQIGYDHWVYFKQKEQVKVPIDL